MDLQLSGICVKTFGTFLSVYSGQKCFPVKVEFLDVVGLELTETLQQHEEYVRYLWTESADDCIQKRLSVLRNFVFTENLLKQRPKL